MDNKDILIILLVLAQIGQLGLILYFFNKYDKRSQAERVDAYNRVPVGKDFLHRSSELPRELFRQGTAENTKSEGGSPIGVPDPDEFDLVGAVGPDIPETRFRDPDED